MNNGHASLVADPYQGFSVVFTDEWGTVVHRTIPHRDMQQALLDAANWFNGPLCIELKMLKP